MNKTTSLEQLKGYFRMLRIIDWIKSFFWIPLIGAFLVHASLRSFLLIAVIYFCATAYSFVVNNYFDIEIDKKDKGKIKSNTNPLAQDIITKRGTLILLGILLFIPLILSVQMNFIGFVFVLLSILASTLYSVKYIRLKEIPVLDIITHGFMFGFFPFLAGAILGGGVIHFPLILIAILFTIISGNQLLIHQIIDYEQDLGNTKTFTIKIGKEISYFCFILLIIASLLCFEVICQFFIVAWWFYYSMFIFLVLCFPLRHIKKFKTVCFSKINQSQ